jgi:hypothetical protein
MNSLLILSGSHVSRHFREIAEAPFESGQATIETEHGFFDIYRASRKSGRWWLRGWFTDKA